MIHVAIIGGGRGGTTLLELLHRDPLVKIVGIADIRPNAPGLAAARKLKIPATTDPQQLIRTRPLHFILDVTGNEKMATVLRKLKKQGIEVIGGLTANFMWKLIAERIKSNQDAQRLLLEYQVLYDLGLKLTSTENLEGIFHAIVDYATHLTATPAGSLSIFNEQIGEMVLVASKGFSKDFTAQYRWKLRKGGLTSHILNQKEPVVIPDVRKYPLFDNPVMLKEGISSLAAVALLAERKIVGILYVDDFRKRKFTPREISLLTLLSTLAAMAIEKAKILERARLLAVTDDLTGLHNHRHFVRQLQNEFSRAMRFQRPLSLLMIDVDHFKRYNDANGHLEGNEVLKEIARLLKESSRDVDIVSRYGGDEFAIIMPESKREKADILAKRLRKRIQEHPFKYREGQPMKAVTISIGCAVFPDNAGTPHELMEKADRALYQSKKEGRDKIVFSSERPSSGEKSKRQGGPREQPSSEREDRGS